MHYDNPSSFFQLSAYLGPDLVPDPCSRYANGMSCSSWPAITLAPNGILVATWYHGGPPGVVLDMTAGDPVTVAGRPGRWAVVPVDAGCRGMGGDEQIAVIVPSQTIWNWEQLDACLRGPDSAANEAVVRALIGNLSPGAAPIPMSSDATIGNDNGFIEAPGRLRLRNVTFTFPATWTTTREPYAHIDRVQIATLGPGPVPTCANWASCGIWPAMTLPVNGLIVSVWASNEADRTLPTDPGTPLTIAGHPAKLAVAPADSLCAAIGGDESMVAVYQAEPDALLTELDACLRGPDLAANEQLFRGILDSGVPSPHWTG